MELIKTTQGGDKLIYNDYIYNAKTRKNGKVRWACTKAYELGCKGAITTDDPMGLPRGLVLHNHGPCAKTVETTKFRQQQKETARRNTGSKTHDILLTGLQTLSNEALVALPLNNTLKRDIQRQKAKTRPVEPQNLQDINLVHPWNSTGGANPLPFLVHDSGPLAVPNRIIVFAADDALRHLASCSTWYMDGNFKCAPDIYEQVYVIRAKLDDGAVSCVYAFLPGKERIHYTELFVAVQRRMQALGLPVNVQEITVDFERGAYNAFRNVFGQQMNINGCFFHLTQSTLRKAQELGLSVYIRDGSPQFRNDFRTFAGMIDALAFVPLGYLNIAVQVLQDNVPDPMMQPLLDYFLDTYVDGPIIPNTIPAQRSPPMFPRNLWNVYQVTLRGGSRTNNICEGWNHSFNVLCSVRHPPVYNVIESIQKDYVNVKRDMLKSQQGNPLTQQIRHEVRTYNRNVTNLCLQYQNNVWHRNMLGYLQRVSYNIRF